MRKGKEKPNAEGIIYAQSILLLCFGIAGWMASSTITAAFDALTNKDTTVAFLVEGKVVTSDGDIPTTQAAGIVGNFELVCWIAVLCASAVALATYIRFKK